MIDPSRLRFTGTHEWVRHKGKTVVVGVAEDAQVRQSDIIHVELPEPDEHHFEAGEDIAVIESVKTSVDLHAPVSGTVSAINTKLLSHPELINEEPYGDGWVVEMKPDSMAEIEELMTIDEYEDTLPEEE